MIEYRRNLRKFLLTAEEEREEIMMKSSKKLTALLLAGLMMTTAACGTKNEPAQGSGSSKGEATITKTCLLYTARCV